MTPAREALFAYARAWTYPVIGNEDVRVMQRLFADATRLGQTAELLPGDPPIFGEWLKVLREAPQASPRWEEALFAVHGLLQALARLSDRDGRSRSITALEVATT